MVVYTPLKFILISKLYLENFSSTLAKSTRDFYFILCVLLILIDLKTNKITFGNVFKIVLLISIDFVCKLCLLYLYRLGVAKKHFFIPFQAVRHNILVLHNRCFGGS